MFGDAFGGLQVPEPGRQRRRSIQRASSSIPYLRSSESICGSQVQLPFDGLSWPYSAASGSSKPPLQVIRILPKIGNCVKNDAVAFLRIEKVIPAMFKSKCLISGSACRACDKPARIAGGTNNPRFQRLPIPRAPLNAARLVAGATSSTTLNTYKSNRLMGVSKSGAISGNCLSNSNFASISARSFSPPPAWTCSSSS